MDFNLFAILGILIAVTGIKVVRQIWRERAAIFDDRFTDNDRAMVSQAAFFLLLPISVALHEAGHAAFVWLFGGDVVGFGFYFFAGYVSYEARFDDVQQILVAAAGTAVNIVLAVGAVAFIFIRRPPMRAAYNELLMQFAPISIANALIFYPLLDLLSNLNGDFRQMYFGGVPWLSGLIFLVHAGTLGGGYLLARNERISARLSQLTGLPPHVRRGFLGGFRLATGAKTAPQRATAPELNAEERTLGSVATRLRSGWDTPLQAVIARGQPGGPGLLVRWRRDDGERSAALVHEPAGSMVVIVPDGAARVGPSPMSGRIWQRWATPPSEDEMVLGLRIAMEEADRRPASTNVPSPV
ncbi:MAG: M50 family metallopeptidase [Thermomicrobiales bacterium]|nr:M50 family metallopeptidase [Thermomicrobiales bacterium]